MLGGRAVKVTDRKSMALVDVGDEESPSKHFVKSVDELDPNFKRSISQNDWDAAAE
jgi:hypothetical protein